MHVLETKRNKTLFHTTLRLQSQSVESVCLQSAPTKSCEVLLVETALSVTGYRQSSVNTCHSHWRETKWDFFSRAPFNSSFFFFLPSVASSQPLSAPSICCTATLTSRHSCQIRKTCWRWCFFFFLSSLSKEALSDSVLEYLTGLFILSCSLFKIFEVYFAVQT